MGYFIGIDGAHKHQICACGRRIEAVFGRALSAVAPTRTWSGVRRRAKRSLRAWRPSLGAAQVPLSAVSGIGAGLAGLGSPCRPRALSGALRRAVSRLVPVTPDNDARLKSSAASGRAFGIVTISGTGMIALGRMRWRARSGGWGHLRRSRQRLYGRSRGAPRASAYDRGENRRWARRYVLGSAYQPCLELVDWLYAPERRERYRGWPQKWCSWLSQAI